LPVQPFHSTLEDIYVANVDTDRGTREKIRFIDTEGLDDDSTGGGGGGSNAREIPRHWLSIADAFVIVYSIDDERSFQLAEAIRRDIERNKEKKEVGHITIPRII
jgi:NF-kappa-B inhibitor-interacting Ras-like protein